ncbi:MAG: hypothetical protein ABII00_16740 [Elusimicrobiota bacterium]
MEDSAHPPQADRIGGVWGGYAMIAMLAAATGLASGMRHMRAVSPAPPPGAQEAVGRPPPPPSLERPPQAASPGEAPVPDRRQEGAAAEETPRPYAGFRHPHFRDPAGSMRHFFTALAAAEEGSAPGPVRAVYFGNSEIGFDRVTSQVRRSLQARFGDGGKGFMVIAPGWRYQRHRDVRWTVSDGWKVHTVLEGGLDDRRYGLGGVLAVNEGPAWVEYAALSPRESRRGGYLDFPAGARFSRFELHYQAYPGGGDVRIEVDGGSSSATVRTNAYGTRDKVFAMELDDAPHRVRVSAGDFPARLYGAVLERDRGFVLDAVMVIGAWANTQLNYDPDHLRRQVAARKPDLVIFQWGAKELMRKPYLTDRQARSFRRAYVKSIGRTMTGRPEASCLVVSPKDMGMRKRNLIVSRPAVRKVVAAAEQAAAQAGCAYVDLFEALGGEGTMARWYLRRPRLVSPDLGHIMRPGAIAVGNVLSAMLFDAYRQSQEGPRGAPPARPARDLGARAGPS